MAMRMSGMMSGMDTESIIQQLVEAKSVKVNKAKKAQIKVNWKQDAWKDLNTKLKNLQSKFISNMRFVSSYTKKTTKVSNSNAVSVITGENAVNGVQALKIKQLAKTGYLTGAELKDAAGNKADYTAMTKLSELGVTGEGTFSVRTGSGSVDVKVNEDTTISDVLSKLKDAGLNASFDAKNQRFFVSAKESGVKNDFSLTASDATGDSALAALGLRAKLGTGENEDSASLAYYKEYAQYFVEDDEAKTFENLKGLIDDSIASRTDSYLNRYKSLKESQKAAENKIKSIEEKYSEDDPLKDAAFYKQSIDKINEDIAALKEQRDSTDSPLSKEQKDTINETIASMKKELSEMKTRKADADAREAQYTSLGKIHDEISEIGLYVDVTETTDAENNTTYSADPGEKLIKEERERFYARAEYASQVMDAYDPTDTTNTGATKVSGQDAIINLNGADFTNNTNVFAINGLTFTALSETAENETVTVTTQNDTDGIYDMIKNFLKEYNAVINEIDKLYNADSSKGYEPLLTDEKDALSESEVEEYEKKIKDSLLRNDSNLSSIGNALKGIMISGMEVNGKKMYLSDFGINTLGYFTAADNEKNAYHIDGDPDDGNTSGNEDKLKSLISSDPDTVISFFTQLSKSLYSKMDDLSKSVQGYRSFGSFYDDKKMKSDYDDYTSKIADLEKKLNAYEDKWYSKFSKMETALAKMQKNASALTGLLGG